MADKVELDIEINSTKAEKSLASLEKNAIKSTQNMERAFSSLKTVAVAALSFLAVKSVVDFFDAGIEGAIAEEQAMARLMAQMEATGEATDAAALQFKELASELESTTKFGDDAVLAAAALAKSFGISNDEAIKLTRAATDLASATGDTLEGAVSQLTATYSGNIKAVAKMVPELKGLTKEQLAAGDAVDLLAARFAGAAQKEIQTYGGAIKQATNTFENFRESFGTLIIQNPAVIASINAVGVVFKELQVIVEDNSEALTNWITGFVRALAASIPATIEFLSLIAKGFDLISFSTSTAAEKTLQFLADVAKNGSKLGQAVAPGLQDLANAVKGFKNETTEGFDKLNTKAEDALAAADRLAQGIFDATETGAKGFKKAEKQSGIYARGITKSAEETAKLKEESKKFLEGLTVQSATELQKIQIETKKAFDELGGFVEKSAIKESDARVASFQITQIQIQKTNAAIKKGLEETINEAKKAADEARAKITEAAANPIKFVLEKLEIEIEPIEVEFDKASLAAGLSVVKQIFNGKEGAEAIVGGIAGGIVSAYAGPEVGGAVGEIVKQLAKGDKDSNEKLTAFLEAFPTAIVNATESIPDVLENLFTSETFIEKMATAILRIVTFAKIWEKIGGALGLAFTDSFTADNFFAGFAEGWDKFWIDFGSGLDDVMSEISRFMGEIFQNGGKNIIQAFQDGMLNVVLFFTEELPVYVWDAFIAVINWFHELPALLSTAWDGIINFFTVELPNFIYDAFKPIFDFFDSLDLGIGGSGGTDFSKPSTFFDPGGLISSLFNKGGIVYAADGFKPRGTDTVPAMLTPGEMVLNRGQQSNLFDLANSGGNGNADMLQEIIDLLSQPMTTEVSAEINGRGIADIILQQSRQRSRLTA